jgi:hypothetical protein
MLYLAVLRRTGEQRHAPIACDPKPQPRREQAVEQRAGAPRAQVASWGQWLRSQSWAEELCLVTTPPEQIGIAFH